MGSRLGMWLKWQSTCLQAGGPKFKLHYHTKETKPKKHPLCFLLVSSLSPSNWVLLQTFISLTFTVSYPLMFFT
jgi:hypothetical protein